MGQIQPIQTVYNGYRFRSRLEARWAVFFDAFGIQYEYEPEGYWLPDGTPYLPDFLIYVRHRSYEDEYEPVYVEVKGVLTKEDENKLIQFPYPLILLGSIPKDVWEYTDTFDQDNRFHSYTFIDGDSYCAYFSISGGENWIAGFDHNEYDGGRAMNEALLYARQARFEHGEKPITERTY